MRYEPPAINFHLGETPPREPQGGGEHTERAVGAGSKLRPPDIPVPPIFTKTRLASVAEQATIRADSLGLDVSRAEHILGRSLPGLEGVIANLILHLEERRS